MTTKLELQVTDASFTQEVERAEGLVLVDFWAPWCGPCLAAAPVIEKLAVDLQGKVKVRKLDTDSNPATAVKYNVRSIPTLLLFKDGRVVDGVIGVSPGLRALLEQKIANAA